MGYYIMAVLGAIIGFAVCAFLVSSAAEDRTQSQPRILFDFELAEGLEELWKVLSNINQRNYRVIAVTQHIDMYTVFFERPADG